MGMCNRCGGLFISRSGKHSGIISLLQPPVWIKWVRRRHPDHSLDITWNKKVPTDKKVFVEWYGSCLPIIFFCFQEWHKITLDDLESKLDTHLTKVRGIHSLPFYWSVELHCKPTVYSRYHEQQTIGKQQPKPLNEDLGHAMCNRRSSLLSILCKCRAYFGQHFILCDYFAACIVCSYD